MTYRVELIPSGEGFTVSCPELPGVQSSGGTEEEALQNIRSAIHTYVDVQRALEEKRIIRFVEVPVRNQASPRKPFRVQPLDFELPKEWVDGKASTLLEILEGPDWR